MTEEPPQTSPLDTQQTEASPEDIDSEAQRLGKSFFDALYKILKLGSLYSIKHEQTVEAIDELVASIRQDYPEDRDQFSIVIRDELAFVNGETLYFRSQEQDKIEQVRDLFAFAHIRGISIQRGLSNQEIQDFLTAILKAKENDEPLTDYSSPNLIIQSGSPTRSILDTISEVNKSTYIAHVYTRGLVKLQNTHDQVRDTGSPEVPTGVIRRILQSVSRLLDDEDFKILGLLPLRLVPPDLSTHSFNTAIYAMLLSQRMGLSPTKSLQVGMAIIYQDIDRICGISVGQRDQEVTQKRQQFEKNLEDVAKILGRLEGDEVSTLRALLTYERNLPFDRPIEAPFYSKKRPLHIMTRITDLCRAYDLQVQGLQGDNPRRPDLAMKYLKNRAGKNFDTALVELFVSTVGIYPTGTPVSLTTGDKAIVVRTPDPSESPERPVVRLLDRQNPKLVDLAAPENNHIEIAASVELQEEEMNAASQVFLLS